MSRPPDHPTARVVRDPPKGLAALLTAYAIWGVLPLYLRALHDVPPLQIMTCRLLLCCAVALVWLRVRGELHGVPRALAHAPTRRRLIASALLISINWLCYVWAVANQRLLEASLGYFINPLLNVVLGVFLLGERLRTLQWAAVGLAALGVGYLTWYSGAPPYIAFVLAFSFAGYGLVRKTIGVDAMTGLATETLLLVPFGISYLLGCELGLFGTALRTQSTPVLGLLALSGLITAVPLWLFAFGARLLPFSTVGLIQYVSPTLQFLIGVFVFLEPFRPERAIGFGCIWTALAVYSADAVLRRASSSTGA